MAHPSHGLIESFLSCKMFCINVQGVTRQHFQAWRNFLVVKTSHIVARVLKMVMELPRYSFQINENRYSPINAYVNQPITRTLLSSLTWFSWLVDMSFVSSWVIQIRTPPVYFFLVSLDGAPLLHHFHIWRIFVVCGQDFVQLENVVSIQVDFRSLFVD